MLTPPSRARWADDPERNKVYKTAVGWGAEFLKSSDEWNSLMSKNVFPYTFVVNDESYGGFHDHPNDNEPFQPEEIYELWEQAMAKDNMMEFLKYKFYLAPAKEGPLWEDSILYKGFHIYLIAVFDEDVDVMIQYNEEPDSRSVFLGFPQIHCCNEMLEAFFDKNYIDYKRTNLKMVRIRAGSPIWIDNLFIRPKTIADNVTKSVLNYCTIGLFWMDNFIDKSMDATTGKISDTNAFYTEGMNQFVIYDTTTVGTANQIIDQMAKSYILGLDGEIPGAPRRSGHFWDSFALNNEIWMRWANTTSDVGRHGPVFSPFDIYDNGTDKTWFYTQLAKAWGNQPLDLKLLDGTLRFFAERAKKKKAETLLRHKAQPKYTQ